MKADFFPQQPPPTTSARSRRWLSHVTIAYAVLLACLVLAVNFGFARTINIRTHNLFPHADKLGHFLFVGNLSLLLNLSLRGRRIKWGPFRILLGTLLLFPVATIEECSQFWLAFRAFSLLDLTADYLGILCFGWIAWWCLKLENALPLKLSSSW